MVEFALVMSLFLMVVFGLVDFALIFAGYSSAEFAAMQAVRYAVVHGSDSSTQSTSASITALVKPYLWAGQANSSTVTTTWNPNNGSGSTVTVSISLSYKTGIPFSSISRVNVGASAQGTVLY